MRQPLTPSSRSCAPIPRHGIGDLLLGLNTSYDFTDSFTVTADISGSTLDRNDIDFESYAGTGAARSGAQDQLTFVTPDNGE